jgi:hypothetical protein
LKRIGMSRGELERVELLGQVAGGGKKLGDVAEILRSWG